MSQSPWEFAEITFVGSIAQVRLVNGQTFQIGSGPSSNGLNLFLAFQDGVNITKQFNSVKIESVKQEQEGIVMKPAKPAETPYAALKKATYNPPVLQNALRVVATNEILISRHRHDFVTSKCGEFFVDGGHDYLRRTPESNLVEDLAVFIDAPFYEKVSKLLWGTRGKDGKQPLRYVFLRECETDHLEAILKDARPGPEHAKVIKAILEKRKENPTWGIGYTNNEIKAYYNG